MVLIYEEWGKTYENSTIKVLMLKVLHFGKYDHFQYNDRYFIKRMTNAGFEVTFLHSKTGRLYKERLNKGRKDICMENGIGLENLEKSF